MCCKLYTSPDSSLFHSSASSKHEISTSLYSRSCFTAFQLQPFHNMSNCHVYHLHFSTILQNLRDPSNSKDDSLVNEDGIKHRQCFLCCVLLWNCIRLAGRKFVIAVLKPPSLLWGLLCCQECLKQETSQMRKQPQDKWRDLLVFLPNHFSPALPFCSH